MSQRKPFKTGKFHCFPRLQVSKSSCKPVCHSLPSPAAYRQQQHRPAPTGRLMQPMEQLHAQVLEFIAKNQTSNHPNQMLASSGKPSKQVTGQVLDNSKQLSKLQHDGHTESSRGCVLVMEPAWGKGAGSLRRAELHRITVQLFQ